MTSQHTETADEESESARSNATHSRWNLEERARDGSLAMAAGGATLASALTALRRSKGRAAALALAGAGLVGLGVRQRRGRRAEDVVTGADAQRDESGEKRVSDEAFAEAERDLGAGRNADESASVSTSETESATEPNPRGMTDRSDVGTDEGDPQFVEGEEGGPHRETHLEDETAHDPRLHPESDGEPTEIDLSDAAMADENSEAAGPHPEQAYPAREGTDPEPTSEKAPERVGEGAVAPTGPSDEGGDSNDGGERGADDEEGGSDHGDETDDESR
ncbi:hypothetical protein ACFQGT_10360 [Natrialbaceae archaeon GCM10025810]|uniref:hypothetical protein n=1 Tax=Halovalidus salilacus TaxID=3075124 RepID=UPI003623086D